jgi:hypothetical protein
MSIGDDDDPMERTMTSEVGTGVDPTKEISATLDDLESLLKNGDVIAFLSTRNVNASIALLGIQGLRAYLAGKKADAVDDFGTVAEEIRARLAVSTPPPADEGRGAGRNGGRRS